jgi:hypothetical protein
MSENGEPRRWAWWVAAVGILVAAVVVALVREAGPQLEDALLTGADFGPGYEVSLVPQDRLGRTTGELPRGIRPAECAELLRARPRAEEDGAAVMARGPDAYYVETVAPAGEWDPARVAEVAGTCATTTFDGGSVTFARIEGVEGEGYALRATITTSDDEVSVGVAASRVDGHLVVLTGAAAGELDETEFVRLANAATERASARL